MADDQTTTPGYNPADYTVEQVNDYLKTADDAERERVLEAERDGKARTGIVGDGSDDSPEGEGLAGTGNPNDLATPSTSGVDSEIAHQEGTPEALAKLADEATEQGYLGTTPEKPDYSQANPAVMNQED